MSCKGEQRLRQTGVSHLTGRRGKRGRSLCDVREGRTRGRRNSPDGGVSAGPTRTQPERRRWRRDRNDTLSLTTGMYVPGERVEDIAWVQPEAGAQRRDEA